MATRLHHADRVQSAIVSGQAANSALVASWRRSSCLHHLDPKQNRPPQRLSERELHDARDKVAALVEAAGSSMNRLYQAVGGVGCCVLLADPHGVPVDRRGSASDDRTFEDWGLWTGSVWSEDLEGTNGIGTCLVEQRALTIHRDQHFHARNTLLSCTASPIYDHHGKIAGALDVSSCRADLTEAFTDLIAMAVADAARRIEADMFRAAFPKAQLVQVPASERGPGGLIAVDRDDVVLGISRAARQTLRLAQNDCAKPLLATDLLLGERSTDEDLDSAERGALRRALARTNGNVSAAAALLGISRATLHRKLNKLGLGDAH